MIQPSQKNYCYRPTVKTVYLQNCLQILQLQNCTWQQFFLLNNQH